MNRRFTLWIKAAEEDIYDAKEAIRRGRWFRAAFYSQQAVEKILKALFFIVKRENPPYIHTVTELYRILKEADFNLPSELENQLYVLNKYYTITRYPDAANGLPSEAVDKIEAERALKIAEEVLEYVKEYSRKSCQCY
ncbi:MAG: HEPN domain-containing protein [archaeon GB-1867-035]|nr:HEPN domain-containing protein [Candidatus Culexmicrobium profundum]